MAQSSRRMPTADRRFRGIMALDVGSKTIGLAITDDAGLLAHALETLERRGTKKDVATLQDRIARHKVSKVVVGMPYELDGSEGRRASRVRVLYEALRQAGIEAELWDERYSTAEAEAPLFEADLSRERRKELIDKLAARVILQSWLDAHRP